MGFLSLLGLSACENWKTIYTGTFQGETYELQSLETKGFSTNRIDYALKLGKQKRVVIDALTTDWGPPYADDLYGKAPRVYLAETHMLYRNGRDNPQRHPSTMLYLSPSRFSKESYGQYAAFLKSEWPAIDRRFSRDDDDRFPQLIGLVYGKQQDFARTFNGRQADKVYTIRVEPDGRIRYMPNTEWANDEYSGLSEKLQMPGKVIYVATGKDAGLSLNQIQTYKDASGNTMDDYFLLKEKPATSSSPN